MTLYVHTAERVCVCVKTQQRTLTGPDHRQDTTANGRRRGPCVRTANKQSQLAHARHQPPQEGRTPVSHARRKRVTRRSTGSTPRLTAGYQQHDRYQNERKCYDWRATAIARYSIPARRAANAAVHSRAHLSDCHNTSCLLTARSSSAAAAAHARSASAQTSRTLFPNAD